MFVGATALNPSARSTRPIVLVSECLGFEACRYNGQVLRDGVVERLAPFVDYHVVCPEVEIGLGTPRDPVRLVLRDDRVRMLQPDTGRDHTSAMTRFGRTYVKALPDIDGAILKGRSPSCGVSDAKVYRNATKGAAVGRGAGLFASAVLDRFPDAAVEDEGRLKNFRIREHFFTRLFLRARFRALKARPSAKALVQFHAENKFLLMAYNQTQLREMGRLVASIKKRSLDAILTDYESHLARAIARAPRFHSHINVLMHGLGHFSRELKSPEKAHFLDLLERYRDGAIPLSAPVSVVRSWIARFDDAYLGQQTFFEPYPEALVEITDSGKGRGSR